MNRTLKFLICISLLLTLPATTCSAGSPYTTYTYSYQKDYQTSPNAYEVLGEYSEFADMSLKSPTSVMTGPQNDIYISDTGNNRIVVLNADYSFKLAIDKFNSGNKENDTFSGPNGIFVDKSGNLYVTDTNNARIVVFDSNNNFSHIVEQPQSTMLDKDFTYIPVAICVDSLGRMYILSRDTAGILVMDKTGEFKGFIGAQNVNVDLADYLWRAFMTKEQIQNSKQYVPINYNNITIDSDEFLYVTSYVEDAYKLMQSIDGNSTTGNLAPIKKLTASGIDVLKRNGFFPPVGDVNFEVVKSSKNDVKYKSDISGMCIKNNGLYSAIDVTYGKIFTYDQNGNLMYAFGGLGNESGLFQSLTGVTYQGTNLIALDKIKNSITVFKITAYGEKIDKIVELQNSNKYDETIPLWKELLKANNNFDLAYDGIGKAYLKEGNFTSAKEYFKIVNDKELYSKAFDKQRQQVLDKYFWAIPMVLLILIFAVLKLFSFAKKYNKKHQPNHGKRGLGEQIMYAFYSIFHPFDGAGDIKHEARGSVKSATCILAAAVFSIVVYQTATGYLFNTTSTGTSSLLNAVGNVMVPFVLFCIANWCLTSLMDGEGSFKNIYVTCCYSLTPIVLTFIPLTVLSHFLVLEEGAILTYTVNIVYFWVILLIFFGMLVVHNYSLAKNIAVTILSIVGIALIMFIALLFVSVMGRLFTFIENIVKEVSFRL